MTGTESIIAPPDRSRDGGQRLADLGLLALFVSIVVLAVVAFRTEGPEGPLPGQPRPPALSPGQILLSLCDPEVLEPERGEQIYRVHCLPCHGEDGNLGLAGARRFGLEPFQNTTLGRGAHPASLFDTLQNGFRKMVSQSHLPVADRIAVIHHVRERLVREHNPGEYVDLAHLLVQQEKPERRQPERRQ